MKLRNFIENYGDIVIYSGYGGIVHRYEEEFKYYLDRKVVHYWIDPINCRAYIQIA